MPDIEGHDFQPVAWAEWPKHVVRSDGATLTAANETEAAEFLQGDKAALDALKASDAASAKARAIQLKADADVAKIQHDAAMAQADLAVKTAEAQAKAAEAAKPAPVPDRPAPPAPAAQRSPPSPMTQQATVVTAAANPSMLATDTTQPWTARDDAARAAAAKAQAERDAQHPPA
jgi:hypothetical protein